MNQPLHLPKSYPQFLENTLILCLNHDSARLYNVYFHELEELTQIHTSDTDFHYSDKEGFIYAPATNIGTIPGYEPHNKEHYERVFLNYLNQKLIDLTKGIEYHRFIIFVPDDLKKITKEKLPPQILKKSEFISGNFTKHHPLELIEKITLELPHLFPQK